MPPKIISLITLYNKGEFAGETWESIVKNTLRDLTKEQLKLHVYPSEGDPTGLSVSKVPELWKWVNEIKQINKSKGVFPEPIFSNEVERHWERLFNLLADQDAAAALAHARCSRTVSLNAIAHIGKRMVRRISGDK
ncbi:MAG TPA: hypothetical protein PLE71_16395 [Flavobacteriales bacterium]|nr:hypothetical protein [Flavobacteriales bacterium]